MKKLLLATGQPKIDLIIADRIAEELGYEVVGTVSFKKDLFETSKKQEQPKEIKEEKQTEEVVEEDLMDMMEE